MHARILGGTIAPSQTLKSEAYKLTAEAYLTTYSRGSPTNTRAVWDVGPRYSALKVRVLHL